MTRPGATADLEEAVRDVLELVLGPFARGTAPGAEHDALDLDSFLRVDVRAALELRFGVRLGATDGTPEDFATVACIAAFLGPRLATPVPPQAS